MRRFVLALATPVFVATALIATSHPAAAASPDPTPEYKEAMASFVNDLAKWADDVQRAADSAVIKPEYACGEEMAEYARIAGWMKADLDGTARLAPTRLAKVHNGLAASVDSMGLAVANACSNPELAATTIRSDRPMFDHNLNQITAFTKFRDGDA